MAYQGDFVLTLRLELSVMPTRNWAHAAPPSSLLQVTAAWLVASSAHLPSARGAHSFQPSRLHVRSKLGISKFGVNVLTQNSVTSMGATSGLNPEIAAAFSSGGFSNMFPRPSYQDNAVNTYLNALGNTYQGRYNSTGRAYPDVSAHGVDYIIRLNGGWYSAIGTSASTPTFASIIALLNDQLLLAGKPLLGFLNPRLYSMGSSAMTDITAGNNPGCGTDGFPADVGWDPVRSFAARTMRTQAHPLLM